MEDKYKIDNKAIGIRIKKIRIQRGISQIELAKALGISQTRMSNIENGNTVISLGIAIKISRILKCSIEEIAYEDRSYNADGQKHKYLIDLDDLVELLEFVINRRKR